MAADSVARVQRRNVHIHFWRRVFHPKSHGQVALRARVADVNTQPAAQKLQ